MMRECGVGEDERACRIGVTELLQCHILTGIVDKTLEKVLCECFRVWIMRGRCDPLNEFLKRDEIVLRNHVYNELEEFVVR